MDKSWMSTDRCQQRYVDGVESFLKFAAANLKVSEIPCPCVDCLNHICHPVDTVEHHLYMWGINQNYTCWIKHGEKEEPATKIDDMETKFGDTEFPTDAMETIEMVQATEEFVDPEKYQELVAEAEKPLYEGCPNFTKLSALDALLNIKSKYGVTSNCLTEILVLLKKMLPEGNEIVNNTYEAKKAMKAMGSGYEKIHACINNCILYRHSYKNLSECPTCGKSRWKVDEKTKRVYENVPANVMWYFPVIPRFKRLFLAKSTATDLRCHSTSSKKTGILRHPSDSPAWKAIDDRFPEIGNDPRNLRLGISTDGVDVNRGNINHSVWPVLAVIYNLPPWLCMKRKFIMLSLLISGVPGKDIDVFLEPLIEDLETLFEVGVEAYDAYAQQRFTLRAVVLWTINDYPALGTLCGCPYSGFNGCVVCQQKTVCIRLPNSAKQSYGGHRRYLPKYHPFRKQLVFNGKEEKETVGNVITGEQIYDQVKLVMNEWGKEPVETSTGRGGKTSKKRKLNTKKENNTYWKKFNIWYRRLRYWRYNSVQHCLDFMHIEKNVAESIVGTLLNVPGKTKDGLQARKDLEFFNIRTELQPQTTDTRKKIELPAATYTLTNIEKDKFCETLHNLRAPRGYCSDFSSLVSTNDRKLIGLKSHDYHMLMQQFLPIAIRSLMPEPIRYAIIRLCVFFKSICSKEIKVEELDNLQKELCVTLCLLEKYFPPSFFDVMLHLTVHLTREVRLCGPICFRWMYPFERCMKVIKGHVRNKTYPEGCIAEENIAEETIEFLSEYQKNIKTVGIPPEAHNDDNDEGNPFSACKPVKVPADLFMKAHFFVLQNTKEIEKYIEEHKDYLKETNVNKRPAWVEKEHSIKFGRWLRNTVEKELAVSKETVSETVKWISHQPNHTVLKYDVYDINGYTFRTKNHDGRVYQNSGVAVEATDTHISKDQISYEQTSYYGVLQEIWVLDYHIKKIPLFMCEWVDNRTVRQDTLGYTSVDLKKGGYKDDPFILASQARQVFYVQDQLDVQRSIVLSAAPRNYRDSYDDANEEFSTVIFPHNHNVLPGVDPHDSRIDRPECKPVVINT